MSDKRLPYRDVPAFLRALRGMSAADAAKDALEWLVLTATRTNETLGARLSEVNVNQATWTVPAERTQSKTELIVPLSARALEIFAARKRRHSGKGQFMFESEPGKPLGGMAMLMQMRRMKCAAVPHGFRYSFAAWVADRAGATRNAEGSLEARRKLMTEWSSYCMSKAKPGKIRRVV
jgi:integrase